jgi:hypothetical protein
MKANRLLPLQILFLNLVTDVFPALALPVGEGFGEVLPRPPRGPDAPPRTRAHWRAIAGLGLLRGRPFSAPSWSRPNSVGAASGQGWALAAGFALVPVALGRLVLGRRREALDGPTRRSVPVAAGSRSPVDEGGRR